MRVLSSDLLRGNKYKKFTRPNLTENNIFGGDYFAVKNYKQSNNVIFINPESYYAVDNSTSTGCGMRRIAEKGNHVYFGIYNPNPLRISKLKIKFATNALDPDNNDIVSLWGSDEDNLIDGSITDRPFRFVVDKKYIDNVNCEITIENTSNVFVKYFVIEIGYSSSRINPIKISDISFEALEKIKGV